MTQGKAIFLRHFFANMQSITYWMPFHKALWTEAAPVAPATSYFLTKVLKYFIKSVYTLIFTKMYSE